MNGAEIRTGFRISKEMRKTVRRLPGGLSSTSGGGILPNGRKVSEENAFQTRSAIIGLTGDKEETYRNAGMFRFWSGCENIIIRNISFVGPGALDIDGSNILEFAYGANHIWVDHCSFLDAQRDCAYVGCRSDFITFSWCTFDYSRGSISHCFATLVGGEDNAEKYGLDCMNTTFAWCSWGKGVEGRTPMVRFGNVHCLNCYYDCRMFTIDPRTDSEMLIEGCYFDRGVVPLVPRIPSRKPAVAYEYLDNYSASGEAFQSNGHVSMPYVMGKLDAREVRRAIRKGAGPQNHLTT